MKTIKSEHSSGAAREPGAAPEKNEKNERKKKRKKKEKLKKNK